MRQIAKLVNSVQVSAGTLAGFELVRQETGKTGEHLSRLNKQAAIPAESDIAQTVPLDCPNVGSTLCASVRGKQVTLRMGRKG